MFNDETVTKYAKMRTTNKTEVQNTRLQTIKVALNRPQPCENTEERDA